MPPRWLGGIHCPSLGGFILTPLLKTFLIPNHKSQGSMGGSETRTALGPSKLFSTHFRVHVVNLTPARCNRPSVKARSPLVRISIDEGNNR